MSGRNPYGSYLYQQSSLLSQRVSKKDPFFQKIALMGVDERVKYAKLSALIETGLLDKDIAKMSMKEIIDKIALVFIQRIGQAKFKADPLTHLGMFVGQESEAFNYER